MIPKIKPSIINGCLMAKLLVPTNLFISISLRLENIVSLIVLLIRKAVTNIKAHTITIIAFSTISKIKTNLSTLSSPYLADFTPSMPLIALATYDKLFISVTLTVIESNKGFVSK